MFTKTILSAGLSASLSASIAAGLILSATPAAAHAAPAQSANTVAANKVAAQRLVHYADLDLATAKGQAVLAARLRHAARAVCDISYGAHPLNEAMEARRCYRSAMQSAQREVASLNNPRIVSR